MGVYFKVVLNASMTLFGQLNICYSLKETLDREVNWTLFLQ
jgi:hypothetical protein